MPSKSPIPRDLIIPRSSGVRASTPMEQARTRGAAVSAPGEYVGDDGAPVYEHEMGLQRSPGCFALVPNNDRTEVTIGEPWIGLGETEDDGGLEGCSERTPGFVYSSDGLMLPVGGSATKTAADMYAEAEAYGRTLLVALVPHPRLGLTGITYRAIHINSNMPNVLGIWEDARPYMDPAAYAGRLIVPIAVLELEEVNGDATVGDVYWNDYNPTVSLGEPVSFLHPWQISVSGSTFSVMNGYVYGCTGPTGAGLIQSPAALSAVALPAYSFYVWVNVSRLNTSAITSRFVINYGAALPASVYVADIYGTDGALTSGGGYCDIVIPLGYVTYSGGVGGTYTIWQAQYSDLIVPWGLTEQYYETRGFFDHPGLQQMQARMIQVTNVCGRRIITGATTSVAIYNWTLNCPGL